VCRQIAIVVILLFVTLTAMSDEGSSIEGIVINNDGKPLLGSLIITVKDHGLSSIDIPKISAVNLTRSDENGHFIITCLVPGRHTVVVIHDSYTPWSRSFYLPSDQVATIEATLQALPDAHPVAFNNPSEKDLNSFKELLSVFEEPELCVRPPESASTESYRFLWLRTFDKPILVHIAIIGDHQITATYKEADGASGYEVGSLCAHESIDVTQVFRDEGLGDGEITAIIENIRVLARENFWNLPYELDEGIIGVDGSTWIVEGYKDGQYHFVNRWSPDESDPFRQFAWFLMSLTKKRFYHDEVY